MDELKAWKLTETRRSYLTSKPSDWLAQVLRVEDKSAEPDADLQVKIRTILEDRRKAATLTQDAIPGAA